MALEAQIEAYKAQPLGVRLLFMAFIGGLYPAYMYYTESEVIDTKISTIEAEQEEAKTKFADSQKRADELPARLSALKKAQDELSSSRKKIAESVDVDDILRKATVAARDAGIKINDFTPNDPREIGGRVRSQQQTIEMNVEGKFIPVTRFLDSLLNLGPITYLTGINYQQFIRPGPPSNSVTPSVEVMRDRIEVRTNARLLVYKKIEIQ